MAQKGHTPDRLRAGLRLLPAGAAVWLVLYSLGMEAELGGSQRKVVVASVAPRDAAQADPDLVLRDGRTLPFVVSRSWSAPAGVYGEQWFLVEPETREVIFESDVRETAVWGLQSLTEVRDEVSAPIDLAPGAYLLVFALGGVKGGELEVEASERAAEEAA
jgi:hypothetical protein